MKITEAEEATVSSEAEEYLEAIYRLEEKTGFARTMELARQLKVVPGSITNTIESLEKKRLVTHEPYRGIKLTEKGQQLAPDVLSRHRLAERLLTEVLRIDWSRVHDPTCGLEPALATEVVRPQENVLGHPSTFPHGNPIPPESGEVFEERSESLIRLESNERGTIVKVREEKREILQYLTTLGLALGATIEMKEKDLSKGSIIMEVTGTSLIRPRNRINNLRQEISFQEVTSILDDELRITCSVFTVAEGLWSYLQKK